MTSNLDLDSRQLAALQKAEVALLEVATVGNKAAKEHLFALDMLRAELTAIDALLKPLVGDVNSTHEAVIELVATLANERQALVEARATVARLEDADRMRSQAHMVVVEDNVRLREEVARLDAAHADLAKQLLAFKR